MSELRSTSPPPPPQESRLHARSWEQRAAQISRVRSSVGRASIAPVAELGTTDISITSPEFGAYGTEAGALSVDGFHALNSNHSSGMDAFAASIGRRRFAVADGMGGAGGGRLADATRRLSKHMAAQVVESGVDGILTDRSREGVLGTFRDANRDVEFTSRINGPLRGARTTLSFVEIGEGNPSGTDVRIVTIGDSPVFLLDPSGKVMRDDRGLPIWYGEDAITKSSDNPLRNYVGFDSDGSVHNKPLKEEFVTDITRTIPPGCKVAIGSDYFSDAFLSGRDDFSPYFEMSGTDFHAEVTGPHMAKGDDATLIIIDPEKF